MVRWTDHRGGRVRRVGDQRHRAAGRRADLLPQCRDQDRGDHRCQGVRILGWNLAPDTTYQLIAIPPSGKTVKASPLTTDAEGNLPADVARFVAGAKSGIHEVQVHPHPWSASQAGEPVARTAFSVLAD